MLTRMETETFRGYMLEATLRDGVLTLHGTTKPARVALAGQDHDTDPVLPVESITQADWKGASAMVNGRLTLHSDGSKYVLHFRRKQQADMERLAAHLGVATARG